MDDDVIVVDDVEEEDNDYHPPPSATTPRTIVSHTMTRQSARRKSTTPVYTTPGDNLETRSTRASTLRARPQPKLKLKLSEKAAAQAPGMSFLGPYDRELDSDDEDLSFEEQFILRMPPGEDCEKLRKMVAAREISNDVWFKFKDSRRAVFHIGNSTYSSKLVDLPCLIESQKTLDNKQMFKVSDICQMLVVEEKIPNEESVNQRNKGFNVDEFIWPHGITPPLHHVRKRRFRKRLNRSTIETVEQEVERLLEEDALADEVQYDVLENVNPELSDSEFIEREDHIDAPTPGFAGSEIGDAPTPRLGAEGEGDDGEEEEEGGEGDIDEELAAELDLALGDDGDGGEGDEPEDDEDDDESEEDDDDDDDEDAQTKKLLNEEIRDLEAAVAKKGKEIASSANPLIRRRFEDALKKLQADLDMKLAQRDELKEKQRLIKEGITQEDVDTEGANEDGDAGGDEGLFGDEPEDMGMDLS
ncbi:TAFII55 protein conserved region-domain-containing protein [Cristinia sonorae]|uniref:TAFII55 protein conserved region-domain-containing protein n=1 Tax=Cristinia sonorae TaxID=1940300 RepID=A0A8K0V0F2_9AGAR|nr:TAFII55 protein conserved region-domain-containing protein [Cristinia sonorae]